MRNTRFIKVIYCHTLVSPGTGAALHTAFFFKALMTDDFPTFGYLSMYVFCESKQKKSRKKNKLEKKKE